MKAAFYILSKRIVLPNDFSFSWIEENPEVVNSGEFSLDITFSLKFPENLIAVDFINRMNSTKKFVPVDSLLELDGRNHSGTFIFNENDDLTVTGQFVAGNSELKYIAKNSKKIWELDWGTETAIDYARALASINAEQYGTFNFICTPVVLSNEIVNNYTISADTASPAMAINGINGKIVMQPWLLYYINKFPELLGYTLKYNVLNNYPRAKIMYFLNSSGTLKYSDALPDWTVSEFQQYVEEFFNVSFIVDAATRTVSIHSFESALADKKTISPKQVSEIKREFNQKSESYRLDFTSIRYNLNDTNFFKWNSLSSVVKANYEKMSFTNLDAIKTWVKTHAPGTGAPLNILLYDTEKYDYYIHVTDIQPATFLYTVPVTIIGDSDFLVRIQLMNKFESYDDDNTRELVLNIVPAEMYKAYTNVNVNSGTAKAYFQCPKYSNEYYIPKTKTLIEAVEGTESTIQRPDKLEIALFTGRIKTYFETNVGYVFDIPTLYPFSHIDKTPEFSGTSDHDNLLKLKTWAETHFMTAALITLKLKGSGGIVNDYHQQSVVDLTELYSVYLEDNPDITAANIFILESVKYFPVSLERSVSNITKPVLCKMYRMI